MNNSSEYTSPDTGILLVNKPSGWTSHDVVNLIRRRFRIKKVGHCGTLDPSATGVLVIVTGKATKLSEKLSGQDKIYETVMLLGSETYSQDADGEMTKEASWEHITPEKVREIAKEFVGEIAQIPPMVSAKKKDGQRLYKLAREGITVERDAKNITIHSLTIDKIELPEVHFTVHCSKGTYIRTLCEDLGRKLDSAAHMQSLIRLSSGSFNLGETFDIEVIKTWERDNLIENLIPLTIFLPHQNQNQK